VAVPAGAVTWSLQGEAHGVTLPQVAMAFPLRHPAVAGIVVGIRSAAEARRNAEAVAAPIPAQVWADLRGAGLLDERAPVD
jgi:D-threo-aldose 1-dehydrogenase